MYIYFFFESIPSECGFFIFLFKNKRNNRRMSEILNRAK